MAKNKTEKSTADKDREELKKAINPILEDQPEVKLEITGSRQFAPWLAEQKISLMFTTYQSGKIFFIGLKPDGNMSIFERTCNRCMGLHATPDTLYMSSLYQLWRFDNALVPGQVHEGYDKLYVPQIAYTTGDIDVHDIGIGEDGRPIFVNTLFACLATVSESNSFIPLWKPKFISKLAAEDRCHLNGLAMDGFKPAYVTAVSTTDVHEGWREHRRDGGVVIDVEKNIIVVEGLSMPQSPRLYQDKLYLLNSGTGDFGYIEFNTDKTKGEFKPLAFVPGYARGLSFSGNFALIGLSKPRENKTFTGLELDDRLVEKNIEARCGIQVIDLRTGDIVHSLNIEGIVEELYDVVTVPNVFRPMALGTISDEIRRTITIGRGPLSGGGE